MIAIATASAKKGEAPRVLARKVNDALGAVQLDPAGERLLRSAQRGANKMIATAPRGAEVTVAISLTEGPLGGWSASVLVDVEEPRTTSRKER